MDTNKCLWKHGFDVYHGGCSCRANRHVALSFEASRCMSDMGLFFSSQEIEMYAVSCGGINLGFIL